MLFTRFSRLILLLCILTGCTIPAPSASTAADSCPATEPLWLKPPQDSAVLDEPAFGYYYANADRSILASAWWWKQKDDPLRFTQEGIKIGWFRPAGAPLEITGTRLDAKAPPLEADVPSGYPTRFQASGVYFPSEGCWKVTASAEKSELTFVVWVDPEAGK